MIPEWLARPARFSSDCSLCRSGKGRSHFITRTLESAGYFFRDIVFSEETAQAPGLLQKLDPRVKLITFFLAIILVSWVHHLGILFFLYGLALALAQASKISWRLFVGRVWLLIPLFAGLAALPALLNVFTPGRPLWVISRFRWGTLSVTRQGTIAVLFLLLRSATSVSWAVLLVLTTSWNHLLKALRVFRVPETFVWIFGMMLRYLQLFVSQAEELHWAIHSRAPHPHDVRWGQHAATAGLGALFRRSLALMQEVYQAMVSRGYTGEVRTLSPFAINGFDWAWMLGSAVVLGGVLWWNRFLS